MPDSRSIVFWAGGKIRSLSIADKKLTTIPFSITQTREVVEPARFKVEVAPDAFHSKMVRWPIVSPTGDRVVFESRGRLYSRQLPKGEASLLTSDGKGNFELFPAWSRDGRWITYVSWSDDKLGSVRRVAAKGGKSRLLSSEPGYYRRPQFSPDGNMVVVEKGVASKLNSPHWSQNPGIYLMPVKGGELRRLTANGRDPHYGATNDRIFLTRSKNASAIPGARSAGGEAHLVSVGLLDNEERTHAWSGRATRLLVSPDENWVAFRENYHVYAAPLPASPSAVQVGVGDRAKPHKGAFPILKLSADGGQFPAWSAGDRISWSMGPTAWQLDVATAFQPGKLDDYKPPSGGISLATAVAPETPAGLVALTGGRLITMDGGERVIENGTLLIKGNRIIGLGAAAEVAIPDSAARVDVTGKTLMPGLIDAHAHGPQGAGGLVPQQNWVNLAYLSLGVTTIHDPSNSASEIFTAAEMQRAGQILAPRIFSTGEIVYGARSKYYTIIDSLDDAREHVRRLKSQGAISVKNYNQPRREQRQQVNAAAAEEGLMVVAEGGSLFHLDMSHITDGITGVEHNVPGSMLYGDVMQLWSGTPVGYTLTLNVTYGGPPGENYWYQHTDVWKHPLLARWVPPRVLQPRAVRRMMAPDSEYSALFDSAANGVRLQAAGIDVNIGGHGQREGLGGHWEMWSFARGGMAPMQVLKTATSSPAHYLGMDADLGSLEVGKLADLLILNSNPLENIYDTDKIDKVMLNGRLYQANTLNEVVTGGRRVRDLYWWNSPQRQLSPNGPDSK
jgi:imidazolonepropionase-like amidohydrolase